MRIQRWFQVALAAAFVFCSLSSAQAQVKIEWWHAMTGALGDRVNDITAMYNKSQSKYEVTASFKGTYPETIQQTIAAYRAGKQPDIVQVFEVGTLTMMQSGAIYPVYQLMKDTGHNVDWSKFVQPVLSYYVDPNNNLLSMPFNSSTPIFYYNLDEFEKAGVKNVPKTWQDMDKVISQLTKAGTKCAYTTSWQSWVHLENYSALHNIPFATNDNGFKGLNTVVEFNNDKVLKHVELLNKWTQAGAMSYEGRTNQGSAAFYSGKCAMLTESSAGYANITKNAKFKWGAAPMPTEAGVKPLNSIIGGATLWVMKGKPKENYQATADFLNFLASADVQLWWHKNTGYVPISLSAYDKGKAEGYYKEVPVQEIAISQLTRAKPTEISRGLRLGNFVQIRTVIDEELENVWGGKKSPKQGLDD
ncbi:MAG TPA: sn-glycerol-3-phosphate ABC transporter substrate-binding protein UgpB, partial [bacterium]